MRLLTIAFLLLLPIAGGADGVEGIPPVVTHAPTVDVAVQNFAIAEGADGTVYLGNATGVLAFDGERWDLTPLGNEDLVRSLALAGDGRLYVGGYDTFGYVERLATGEFRYESLTDRFGDLVEGDGFADIWDTVVAPEGIYFKALRDVFFLDGGLASVQHWRHAGRFGVLFRYRDETYLQFRGEGLRRRAGDQWVPVPGTAALTELLFEAIPLQDGGVLLFGRDDRWWRFDGRSLTELSMPDGMPPPSVAEHGTALSDGSIALGTADGRLLLVDASRQRLRAVTVDEGFISGLAPSRFGGLLVGADGGFHHVRLPSRWTVLGDENGIRGTVYRVAQWAEETYVLTTAGALRADRGTEGSTTFVRDERVPDSAHALWVLDEEHALIGTPHDLLRIGPGGMEVLAEDIYPRGFWAVAGASGALFVGTEGGLRRLDPASDGYRIGDPVPADGDVRVISLLQREQEVWLGTGRDGVWRIPLDASGRFGEATQFDEAAGLELGVQPFACIDEATTDAPLVSTGEGFFRWNGETFERVELDGLEALREDGEALCLAGDPAGIRWAASNTRVFRRAGPGVPWQEERIQLLRRGEIVNEVEVDGRLLVAASKSLLLREPGELKERSTAGSELRLTRVTWLGPDGDGGLLPLAPDDPQAFAQGDWGIRFEFAMQRLDASASVRYRGRLVPYETEFSNWSRSRSYTYSNLRPRDYVLELQAMDGEGRVSSIRPYVLQVVPPWHATPWARAAGFAALLLLLGLAVQQLLRRRTAQLSRLVEARTAALADATRELERLARRDGLTGAANRRALDERLAALCAPEVAGAIALLAIDVDHFKRYNDEHGHQAGDRLLQRLVETLEAGLSGRDQLLARYGGEEFMVVLPAMTLAEARALAERLRAATDAAAVGTTISIGVAASPAGDPRTADALIGAADRALYAAKAAGRNRICGEDEVSA
ncbi:MAG: diguanylate cyclase [Pseudomonadota bacterium]